MHLKICRRPLEIPAQFYCLSMFSVFMQGKNNGGKEKKLKA